MTKSILLVEDNEDDVFAFKRSLAKLGVTLPLHVAEDGRTAVSFLTSAAAEADPEKFPLPSLVFLDLKLPYRGGLEILEWMRSTPKLVKLPVIVLSGSNEDRDRARATELNAKGYLVKPASMDDLKHALGMIS